MKENNIEEDIKYIEDVIALAIALPTGEVKIQEEEIEAMQHILSDYKRLQEEFKQVDHECNRLEQKEIILEKENNELKYKYNKSLDDLIKSGRENFDLKNKDRNTELLLKKIEKLQKENEELTKASIETAFDNKNTDTELLLRCLLKYKK